MKFLLEEYYNHMQGQQDSDIALSQNTTDIFLIQVLQFHKPYPRNQLDIKPMLWKNKVIKKVFRYSMNKFCFKIKLFEKFLYASSTLVISPCKMEMTPITAQTTRNTMKMIKHPMSVYVCRFKFPPQFTIGFSCWGTDSTLSLLPQQPMFKLITSVLLNSAWRQHKYHANFSLFKLTEKLNFLYGNFSKNLSLVIFIFQWNILFHFIWFTWSNFYWI